MDTRKYPRTLQEAFGPHTNYKLVVDNDPLSLSDGCVLVAFGLAVTLYSWL